MEDKNIKLPEENYAEYLATKAGAIADEKACTRDLKWRGIISLVVFVLAVFGYSNLANLEDGVVERVQSGVPSKDEIKSSVFAELRPFIETEVEEYYSKNKDRIAEENTKEIRQLLKTQTDLINLFIIADDLDEEEESFTNEQRDAAIGLITDLAKTEAPRNSKQFRVALEKVVKAFDAADLNEYVDRVEKEVRNVGTEIPQVTMIMLLHYGQRVVGGRNPSEQEIENFRRYQLAAKTHNLPELAVAYALLELEASSSSDNEKEFTELWRDFDHLEAEDQENFFKVFNRLRLIAVEPSSADAERLANVGDRLIDRFPDRFVQADLLDPSDPELLKLLELFERSQEEPQAE